eukprot:CAMPEP_0206019174 /NCGR_PEP_ID=MMETSP1464-20131121/28561_1 /ASSEMBLY_ACC=CAM_ASM_001124 /TAXON_ID=119497 /ORGANISM="Exanthemachrysis gayraliae, Strain RCC1523" /LENGTH=159 /DNA_ID=CAMNT_0053393067 /DNA_START=142 /DNA_END=617 /DNA_ORIENTATION=-
MAARPHRALGLGRVVRTRRCQPRHRPLRGCAQSCALARPDRLLMCAAGPGAQPKSAAPLLSTSALRRDPERLATVSKQSSCVPSTKGTMYIGAADLEREHEAAEAVAWRAGGGKDRAAERAHEAAHARGQGRGAPVGVDGIEVDVGAVPLRVLPDPRRP